MSNITSSMMSAASALRAFERALATTQNNVSNAFTPGYAKQRTWLVARPFSAVDGGTPGGVDVGGTLSSRSAPAEQSVRRAQEQAGFHSQREATLSRLEPVFEVGANAGLGGAFNAFFQNFSTLAVSPSDPAAREVVIAGARTTAERFQNTAEGLNESALSTEQEIRGVTNRINDIGVVLRDLNVERREAAFGPVDPSLDAAFANALEDLSQLVDYSALQQPDGTYSVVIGGRGSFVMGDKVNPLNAEAGGVPARILDASGRDISASIDGGSLAALLDTRNRLIPALQEDLDGLAKQFADSVNTTLRGGLDASGNAPTVDLFTYAPGREAASMAITDISGEQIAAASAGAPGGNGNALALVSLGSAPEVDGQSFSRFYGNLAGRVGRELSVARESSERHDALVNQATAARAEISGVSLDEEAIYLLQYQRAYEAAARMVVVLNEMADVTMSILR